MKKIILILIAIMMIFVACNKTNENVASKNENESLNVTSEKNPDKEKTIDAYPAMVKVRGVIYVDTGFQNAMVSCGTPDGQIKTTVDGTEKPKEDDESNFGKGYSYQTWDEQYVNVQIDNKWILFKNINIEDESDKIPEWVAHFTAKVIKTEEDSLLVEATDIDDRFYFKKLMTRPISLSIENLDNGKDGKVSTEDLEEKSVEVYFGGEVKNTEIENLAPIELEKIYRISVK